MNCASGRKKTNGLPFADSLRPKLLHPQLSRKSLHLRMIRVLDDLTTHSAATFGHVATPHNEMNLTNVKYTSRFTQSPAFDDIQLECPDVCSAQKSARERSKFHDSAQFSLHDPVSQ